MGTPDEYFAYVVVGLMIFAVLTSTLSAPVSTLRAELQAGTFERMVLSAFGPVRSIASLLIFPLLLSLIVAVVSLAYASIVFGLDLRWSTAPAAIPLAVVAAAAFAPFGILMTAAVVVFKQTNAGATFLITGITLLAGVYFPVDLLPGWIAWASEVQPFTPAVDLLRNALVGTPLEHALWADLVKLAGFAVAMVPLSVVVLRAAVDHSRRKGTITEY